MTEDPNNDYQPALEENMADDIVWHLHNKSNGNKHPRVGDADNEEGDEETKGAYLEIVGEGTVPQGCFTLDYPKGDDVVVLASDNGLWNALVGRAFWTPLS